MDNVTSSSNEYNNEKNKIKTTNHNNQNRINYCIDGSFKSNKRLVKLHIICIRSVACLPSNVNFGSSLALFDCAHTPATNRSNRSIISKGQNHLHCSLLLSACCLQSIRICTGGKESLETPDVTAVYVYIQTPNSLLKKPNSNSRKRITIIVAHSTEQR